MPQGRDGSPSRPFAIGDTTITRFNGGFGEPALPNRKVVHPLGFEPKSPASEARILSIEIRVPDPDEAAEAYGSQPFPTPSYLAGITRSAKSA